MKIWIVVIVLLLALSVVLTASANAYWTLAVEKYPVMTSAGTLLLPAETRVGGDFKSFITLTQQTTFTTKEEGLKTFPVGTEIDCDHEPGSPDPCP